VAVPSLRVERAPFGETRAVGGREGSLRSFIGGRTRRHTKTCSLSLERSPCTFRRFHHIFAPSESSSGYNGIYAMPLACRFLFSWM
jgi:hypothetical protein